MTQPSPGDQAAVLLHPILQAIGKLINRRVGSAIRRLGNLLDGGGGILRSRVRHDGGVHAADLPLDEVQVGTGPGALVLQDPQLQADPIPHVQPAYPEPAAPGLVSRPIRLEFTKLFPRSRGVYEVVGRDGVAVGRGELPAADRIIPARTGSTPCPVRTSRACPDHPRSRGVYADLPAPRPVLDGSSPLARGLRVEPVDDDR